MSTKHEGNAGSPWLDIRSLRWSSKGELLVQGPDHDDFIHVEEFLRGNSDVVLGPAPNPSPCSILPDPNPAGCSLDGYCGTLQATQIRLTPEGLQVRVKNRELAVGDRIRLVDPPRQ